MQGPIDIEYLHQNDISGVIAEGLTDLYEKQPDKPIEYLANWLLQHCKTKKDQNEFKEQIEFQKKFEESYIKFTYELKLKQELRQQYEQEELKKDQDHLQYLNEFPFYEDLLIEEFPNYLQKKFKLSGVYICQMTNLKLEVDQDLIDDPLAFIDSKSPKLLQYIGTSENHKFLLNTYLPQQAIITYDVAKPMQPLEDGTIPQNLGKYIPDVTKEHKLYFHRFPKLGCYYVIPMYFETHLFEDAFDQGLLNRIKYQDEIQNQQVERENKTKWLEEQLQTVEDEESKKQLQIEYQSFIDSQVKPEEQEYLGLKQELLICMDTLGQDRQLTDKERLDILCFTQQYGQSITKKQAELLSDDINAQISYLNSIDKELQEKLSQEEKEFLEEEQVKFEELQEQNEQDYQHEIELLKFQFLKKTLFKDEFQNAFRTLINRRVLKFQEVIRAALFIVGSKKEQITIENQLDWKKVSKQLDEAFFFKLSQLNPKGPKGLTQPYASINRLQKQLEKIDEEKLGQYNYALFTLYNLIQKYCSLRKQDVEIRNIKYNEALEKIKKQQEEFQKYEEKKELELNEAKAQFKPEEEGQEFNEEEWFEQWKLANEKPEVDQEPGDEEDLDIE